MRTTITRYLVLALMLTASTWAQDHVLFENTVGGDNYGPGGYYHSQTFTMTAAGRLSRIRMRIKGGTGQVMPFDLCTTSPNPQDPAGIPNTTTPIYSGSVVLPNDPNYQDVDLDLSSANYDAVQGEFLAIRLPPGGSIYVEAGQPASYAGGGIWVDNGGVPGFNPSRDYYFQVYVTGGMISATNPYFEDFEHGPRGWSVDNGVWELGTPAQNFIAAAWSGTNAWMTDLDANYPGNSLSAVTSSWFDCSTLTEEPVISLALTFQTNIWNDGARLELDLDDGLGFRTVGDADWYGSAQNHIYFGGMTGLFWGGGTPEAWRVRRNKLEGVAGRSRFRVRVLFASDPTYAHNGVAFDDVKIEVPRIRVDATTPYLEDFELPGDGFLPAATVNNGASLGTAPLWERGAPTKPALGSPYSGIGCWATDLDAPYMNDMEATLTSPACDFTALTEDPVLEFALSHSFSSNSGGDGLRVEVDLGDGNGYQTLGTLSDWYDGTLNISSGGSGGIAWKGTSQGWRILRHDLTGAAGLAQVRFRFLFSSNLGGIDAGALVDDVHIFVPTFKGTESTAGDDIRMQIYVDGAREVGQADSYEVQPGEQTEVFSISPEGDLTGGEYYLVGEIFGTGSTYTNVAPDVWISLGPSSVLLQGGVLPPFYVPMQMGPFGTTLTYYYGGGAAGYSCRVQALIFLPFAANGLYASSDAFELKFQ